MLAKSCYLLMLQKYLFSEVRGIEHQSLIFLSCLVFLRGSYSVALAVLELTEICESLPPSWVLYDLSTSFYLSIIAVTGHELANVLFPSINITVISADNIVKTCSKADLVSRLSLV